jgi:hypothetical protein
MDSKAERAWLPKSGSPSAARTWIATVGWMAALLLLMVVVLILLALFSPLGLLISAVIFGLQPNAPLCHKQLIVPILQHIEADPNGFLPNADGLSEESFAVISEYHGKGVAKKWLLEWSPKYKYVAGLQKGDPGDLVVCYLAKPTRWVMHILSPKAWDPMGWIICPLDEMTLSGGRERKRIRPGENSETLTNEQFRERLQKTLDYLKANQRPHWEVVVKEHQAVLDSLDSLATP